MQQCSKKSNFYYDDKDLGLERYGAAGVSVHLVLVDLVAVRITAVLRLHEHKTGAANKLTFHFAWWPKYQTLHQKTC